MNGYSSQFERARQAVATITTIRPHLSSSELESLALMLDRNAMETIQKSFEDARNGDFESLEDVVRNS